jgi:tetratricopeptide (TPR) repeat protein
MKRTVEQRKAATSAPTSPEIKAPAQASPRREGLTDAPSLWLIFENEKIEPQDELPFRFLKRAMRLWRTQHFAEALASADRGIELAPNYGRGHAVRAALLMVLDRGAEALAAADRAIELEPEGRANYAVTLRAVILLKIGESKKSDYTDDIMDDAAKACKPAADYFGLSIEKVRRALEALRAAERETTGRATAEPRLKWEKDALPDEDPATFAWRAYQAEAKAGTLHRGVIGQEDKALSVKLANWLRTHDMPEGIDIPTKPEWNTRQLAEAGDTGLRAAYRLSEVARRRKGKPSALAAA